MPFPDEQVDVEQIDVAIDAGAGVALDFGCAFPLTVTRSFARELEPEPWRDAWLAPLFVREVGVARREEDGRIVETRQFSAYAFERDELVLAPRSFTARPRVGGTERVAWSAELRRPVQGALAADSAVEPELPAVTQLPVEEPSAHPAALVLAIGLPSIVLLLAAWLALRRRARRAAGVSLCEAGGVASDSPQQRALARLAALNAGSATQACAAAAAIFRDFAAERFALNAVHMTSEEFAASPAASAAFGSAAHGDASALLQASDHAKFAGIAVPRADAERLITAASAIVRSVR